MMAGRPLVGQPILAAAGFQPALFVSRFVGFCRNRRSRQGSSVARVNALRSRANPNLIRLPASRPGGRLRTRGSALL